MIAALGAVFLASLLGSPHCAGMCGGFVAFYAGTDRSSGSKRVIAHAAYSGGRLATYAALGALFGALGSAIDLAGSLAGVARAAAVVAGTTMVVWGGYTLLQALNVHLPRVPAPGFARALTLRAHAALGAKPPLVRALLLGLASTLLPCGWLYAFAMLAAGTGSVGWGAAVMAAFWLGTLPLLLTLGAGIQAAAGPVRRYLPALAAAILVVVGLVTLLGRSSAPVRVERTKAPVSAEEISQRARDLGAEEPLCPEHAGR